MTKNQKISFSIFVLLLILFTIRIDLALYLWKKAEGCFIISRGDDMARVLNGYFMQNRSSFNNFINDFTPLSSWLYAQGLRAYPDVFVVPAVINTMLGMATILILFFLCRAISGADKLEGNIVGLLSVVITIFYPPFVWATLAGDRYLSLLFCVYAGLFLWLLYIKKGKKVLLLFSAIAFLFSTTAMHQGWIFATIFSLFIFKDILLKYRNSRRVEYFLIGCILIACSFICVHIYKDYYRFGNLLGFLINRHNTLGTPSLLYERITCHPALLTKAFIFPVLQLFWYRTHMTNYPLLVERIVFVLFIGVFFGAMIQAKRIGCLTFSYSLFIVSLLLSVIILTVIGMTVSCPLPAELVIYFFCWMPLLSIYIYWLIKRFISKKIWVQLISISLIIIVISSVNIIVSMYPPKSMMRKEAIQLGILLRSLYSKSKVDSEDTILLEQRTEASNYSLAIEPYMLQIFSPDKILFDREWKPILKGNIYICDDKDNPSLFEKPLYEIQSNLQKMKCRLVIIITDQAEKKIQQIMTYAVNIGEYHIYVFLQDEKLMKYIRDKSKQLPVPWLGRNELEEPLS